ncbi:unnamed protein product [Symbiodinium microadriaticum]|nr:unnamed protein product [Symbiodinium microadriaticum]
MSSTVNDDKSTNKMEALQRLHNHAASLGGECLARKYDNSRTKVLWRCKHGHQWLALPSAVLKTSGTWCPDCAADDKKLGLSVLQAHARSLGGQCLAAAYDNARTKVSWQCKLGHEWRATTDSVLRRHSWCPECALESRRRPRGPCRKLDLQALREHASALGGTCLAGTYRNSRQKLTWQCKYGHTWNASTNSVLHGRTWCPQCSRNAPLGLKALQDHAASVGGVCLADRYTNRFSKVLWRCRHGHEWQAMPAKVVREGTWCPHCAKKAPVPWARLQAHAATFGGQCLMANYQNLRHKLTWRCKEGHKWMATGGNVLHGGTWCPQCAAKNRALRAEPEVRRIFEEIFFTAKFKTSFPRFLSGLQLDGHCAEMHLAFEYQGEQHYDPDHFFHSRDPQGFSKQRERDARKATLCERAGIRLVVVPCFVKDKRTFIQLALLRWFTVRQAQHVIPGVPPQWLAFQGNFEPPTKPKAQVSPRMKSSKAERKVDLQTMDHIRVLHYEDSRRKGRLVVQRWRNGHADLTVPNCETQGTREGCPGGQWQEGLRNTVCDNLLTFSGVYN